MVTQMLKFSIITPSYNQGLFLEETINSILGQNFSDFEYIVIDGKSNDNSVNIIKKHEKDIVYWVSEPDTGQAQAINKGFEKASGDILTWINSDDLLTPNSLSDVAKIFQNNKNVDMIHGKARLFGKGVEKIIEAPNDHWLPYKYLAGMPFAQPASFFRKSALDKVGFLDESLQYGMDFDLFVRFALNCTIQPTDTLVAGYRLHNASKTTTAHLGFARDWNKVFSRVLNSFSTTESIIKDMNSLGLYVENEKSYPVTKSFDTEFLSNSFHWFLRYQAYFYYESEDLNTAKEICRYLKVNAPQIYQQEGLSKLLLRSKLSKNIVHFARQVFR